MTETKKDSNKNYSAKIKHLKGSEVEIEGEISAEAFASAKRAVLDEARKDMTIPGFRKGNVPDNILLNHVNNGAVMQEAAEMALNEFYPQILKDNNIDALGTPETAITKLADGNPLGFKMKVGVVPEIKLPDLIKIAKNSLKNEAVPEASDEEVRAVMENVRRLQAGKKENEPAEGLPELTDESVKKLGKFENLEDFKNKLRENIGREKKQTARKVRRTEMVNKIADEAKITLPEIVVNREVEELHRRFKAELEESKTTFEDYLAKMKRTEKDILAQHRAYIENSLKTRLVLDKIAREKNITADKKEIDQNVEYLMTKDPESDRSYLEHYVETVLTNEAVIDFLEKEAEQK